jgi:PD-(D/E)XK nuclease superfamily protein
MTRPPFPTVVDSSMLSAFRACPRKFAYTYLDHWKPAAESVHLVAGKAFASGLEAAREAFYIRREPAEEAQAQGLAALWREYGTFEEPEDSPKGPLRMAGALEYYFSRYPLGSDGATPRVFGERHGIEFSFVEPVSVVHPETGDPILYSGRADMVCDSFGGLYIYDEKTTGQLGPTWAGKWEHRSQFTAYCWGLRGHGIHPTGIVVRGIAILKDSYNDAQAITYRSDWEVDRWLRQVERDLHRMIAMWEAGEWDYALDDACTAYAGCPFARPCKSADPQPWLEGYFHKRRWDPVLRLEHVVEP